MYSERDRDTRSGDRSVVAILGPHDGLRDAGALVTLGPDAIVVYFHQHCPLLAFVKYATYQCEGN
jgi:hypothetical protein